MYSIQTTNKFEKDYKLLIRRNYNIALLEKAIELLENKGYLPAFYKPHKLSGNFNDCWEGHIKPDWLLVWKIDEKNDEITLIRTGTHSGLF